MNKYIKFCTIIPIRDITNIDVNCVNFLKVDEVKEFNRAINKSYFNTISELADKDRKPKINKQDGKFLLEFYLKNRKIITNFPPLTFIDAWSHYDFYNSLVVNWDDGVYSSIIGDKLVPVNYKIIINTLNGLPDEFQKIKKYYFECLPIYDPINNYF